MQTETTSNVLKTPLSPDGMVVGQSATDKIGFYGATPVAQRAGSAQAAVTTTAATSTTPFGYSEAQANAIVALVNEMRAALVAVGIIKGAS
jgi:UDP-N-acetyl-D-mannosaminuronic acid transferase (WecB/TagA/CpsF family)